MKYDNDNKAHLRYRSRLPAVEGGYIRYKPDVPVSIVDKKATNFPWLNEKEEEEKKSYRSVQSTILIDRLTNLT